MGVIFFAPIFFRTRVRVMRAYYIIVRAIRVSRLHSTACKKMEKIFQKGIDKRFFL